MKRELNRLPPRLQGRGDRTMIKPIDPGIRLDGFVLAGGESSRMGKDKAQMTIGGIKLFERAATALSEICHQSVSLVSPNGTSDVLCTELDIAALPDLCVRGRNLPRAPIIGLYTALIKAQTPWINGYRLRSTFCHWGFDDKTQEFLFGRV